MNCDLHVKPSRLWICPEPRFRIAGLGIVVTVCGLHCIPVCPVLLVHVSKDSWQLLQVGTDILLVGIAFEQAAGNGGNLRSGNVVVRLERSVCIACDPSASRRIGDGLDRKSVV